MSTIAELLVKIGADNSGLKKGLSESQSSIQSAFSSNPINEFTGALTGATNGISGMIGKISGLAALAAGGFGLGALVDGAVDAGERVYQLGTRLGISATEAAELSRILKLTGGDSESFATAMMRLDKNFGASGEAGNKARAVLSAFGVSLTDSNGKLLPLNQQLAEMSKGYKLAETNGLQQEFVMQTLGTRGLSLVKTLKDYDEAAQNASKVKGIGLDPQQMHELKQELDVVKMEAGQVGLAFTGALAPVAQEIFPPIMSGLQNTAAFLAENKFGVIELTKNVLELVVAYKSVQILASASNAIGIFWKNSATQAAESVTIQTVATNELSVAQERSIARAVAASNKAYAKMETDAVKTAQTAGLSAEETAAVITEKCVQISIAATEAALEIRTQMTNAFLANSAAAVESAAVTTGALAEQGVAATLTGEKTVAANELAVVSGRTVAGVQTELAAANVISGNSAVIAGEKTVGAMATAGTAVRGLLSSVWLLMGGWIGVAAAIGYAAYKLYDYYDTKNMVESYDPKAKVYKDPVTGELTKQAWVEHNPTDEEKFASGYTGQPVTSGYERVPLSPAEIEKYKAFEYKKEHALDPPEFEAPKFEMPQLGGLGGSGVASGKSEAEKELEKLQKAANTINSEILKEYNAMNDSKIDAVNRWYDAEKQKLDDSKSENTARDAALAQLDAIRAEKLRKASVDMLSNSTSIWIEAAKNARTLNDLTSTAGMEGPQKELLDMQNKYNDSLAETIEKYKQLSVKFMGMDKESQIQYLAANPDVTAKNDGSLDFTKRLAAEKLAITKNYEQQVLDYHTAKRQQAWALDKAYQAGDIAAYGVLLRNQESLLEKHLADKQALIDEQTDLWKKANHSVYNDAATLMGDVYSGLENVFEKIAHGTEGAIGVIKGFTNAVVDSLIKIQAQAAAARITQSISGALGNLVGGTAGSLISVSTGPSYISGTVDPSSVFKFADGGIVTGPTLGMIGEAGYSEAVVPLTPGGLKSAGLGGGANLEVNVNNYGNSQVDVGQPQYNADVGKYVLDIVIDGASRNVGGFGRNLKTALGG